MKFKHEIGYACMNMDIKNNVYKTCRLKDVSEEKLIALIEHNLQVLNDTIDYNIQHNNKMFRVSSSLIPFASHSVNTLNWEEIFKSEFDSLRNKITDNDIRISCHPGQYTLINSPNDEVVKASIRDLEYHTKIMDLLSGNPKHKMIIHVGGIYGDKDLAIQRFIENYNNLDVSIRKYLVIENDDKLFTVEDILKISALTGVPCVFDNLHHECNPSCLDLSPREIINKIVATWSRLDGRPKVHYSQQDLNKRAGAHSYTIDLEKFIVDCNTYYDYHDMDIMLEVKDKNRSFLKVNLLLSPDKVSLEKEWARYKYLVMSKSQKNYNQLRHLFKEYQNFDVKKMYKLIDESLYQNASPKAFINAYDHCWGYFKKVANDKEKSIYQVNKELFLKGNKSENYLKSFLKKLASKYEVKYLLDSYFLK